MCSLEPNQISVIKANNAAIAWAKAFLACYDAPGGQINQANVLFDNESGEDSEIRVLLDSFLRENSGLPAYHSQIETVAGTIFPEAIWKRCKGDKDVLFERYRRMFPMIRNCNLNHFGIYFSRLIDYPCGDNVYMNQLDFLIEAWKEKTRRKSAFQAGIFNPHLDHSKMPRRGFPCLQQLVFKPNGIHGNEGLSIVAFYATQTILEKAYGNYLGLLRLGRFMSKEMGIPFKNVICIASSLQLSASKKRCKGLFESVQEALKNAGE